MKKFLSIRFQEDFPGTLSAVPAHFAYSEGVRSKWADNPRYATNTSKTYWQALRGWRGLDPDITVGKTANGDIVVEKRPGVMLQFDNVQVVILEHDGTVKGGVYAPDGHEDLYSIRTDTEMGHNGVALTAAFLDEQAATDLEVRDELTPDLDTLLAADGSAPLTGVDAAQRLGKAVALLGDNFYRRTVGAHVPGTPMLANYPTSNADILPLSRAELANYELDPSTIKGKEPTLVKVAAPSAPATAPVQVNPTVRPDIDLSLFGETVYTAESGLGAAKVPVWHQWRSHEAEMAQRIADSFAYAAPMQVVGFFGPAGCGKTETATALADLLGLDKVVASCGPDTDSDYFWGSYRPKVGANGVEYEFVEGPLTKALRYGCLLEIQEVGLIRRAGVVAELNDVLEAGTGKEFTLPTGERVAKNPHFVAVFTSNDSYEGTNTLNQSVLSRMNEVLYFENPTPAVMAQRTLAVVTDWKDQKALEKMANCICQIGEACRKRGVEDGVCGQRELTNWAITCRLLMKRRGEKRLTNAIIREAAQSAVLNKASQNREEIVSLGFETLNKHYGDFAATVVG